VTVNLRIGLCLALAVSALCASGCRRSNNDGSTLLVPPLIQRDAGTADVEPGTGDAGPKFVPLLDAEAMAVVLPKLKRRSTVRWERPNTLVSGHFSTHLVARDGDRSMLILTIDDLIDRPARIEWLRSSPNKLRGMPAEIARDAWIRVLASNRFEVVIRSNDPSFNDSGKLQHWLEQLKLDALARAVQVPPDVPPPRSPRR